MDVTSYLLGKKAGGGGGTPTLQDKSVTITENGTQNVTADSGYDGLNNVNITANVPSGADLNDYFKNKISSGSTSTSGLNRIIKNIPDFLIIIGDSTKFMFSNCDFLTSIPQLDTQNVTNMQNMFRNCTSLTTIPLLNTQNVTIMQGIFDGCKSLISIPLLNTQNVTNMQNMFADCTNLTTIPVLNTSKIAIISNLFAGCTSLSDNSLDNILQMCINATSYTGAKTLVQLGFEATNYPTSRIQALPHYQDFMDAGWTIGY